MSDPRDLLTLPEAKDALRVGAGDSKHNDLIAGYITAVSRALDKEAGNTVAMSVTSELHDGTNSSGRACRPKIILRRRPVLAVASVIEHVAGVATALTAETTTMVPSAGWLGQRYDPDPTLLSGLIRRRQGGCDATFPYGRENIAVTYTAGRVASTAEVDQLFKRAAAITLQNLWRDREPSLEAMGEFNVPRASFPTFAIPNAAQQLLSEEIGQNKTFGIA